MKINSVENFALRDAYNKAKHALDSIKHRRLSSKEVKEMKELEAAVATLECCAHFWVVNVKKK